MQIKAFAHGGVFSWQGRGQISYFAASKHAATAARRNINIAVNTDAGYTDAHDKSAHNGADAGRVAATMKR